MTKYHRTIVWGVFLAAIGSWQAQAQTAEYPCPTSRLGLEKHLSWTDYLSLQWVPRDFRGPVPSGALLGPLKQSIVTIVFDYGKRYGDKKWFPLSGPFRDLYMGACYTARYRGFGKWTVTGWNKETRSVVTASSSGVPAKGQVSLWEHVLDYDDTGALFYNNSRLGTLSCTARTNCSTYGDGSKPPAAAPEATTPKLTAEQPKADQARETASKPSSERPKEDMTLGAAQLEARTRYWATKLPLCTYDGNKTFPSKCKESYVDGVSIEGASCEDGDTVIFNGLTCAAGDDRGCDAVARSRTAKGVWFRSPKRLFEKYVDPTGKETIFSNDHALGAMLYVLQKKDKEAFRAWINAISENGKYLGLLPKYCTDDRCAFKPIDCPLLDRTALALGEANPVCDPSPVDLYKVLHDIRNGFDQLMSEIKKIPGVNVFPATGALQKAFDAAAKFFEKAIADGEHLQQLHDTFARALTNDAAIITAINSEANDAGFARHDAAVSAFVLMKYGGITHSDVSAAARTLTT